MVPLSTGRHSGSFWWVRNLHPYISAAAATWMLSPPTPRVEGLFSPDLVYNCDTVFHSVVGSPCRKCFSYLCCYRSQVPSQGVEKATTISRDRDEVESSGHRRLGWGSRSFGFSNAGSKSENGPRPIGRDLDMSRPEMRNAANFSHTSPELVSTPPAPAVSLLGDFCFKKLSVLPRDLRGRTRFRPWAALAPGSGGLRGQP